jgi:hypothetical protein
MRAGAIPRAREAAPKIEAAPEELSVALPPADPAAGAAPAETDDSAPWPTEADETAFRAGAPPAALPAIVAREEAPLPPLDDLVARIPEEVRHTLDDLFRAKFTAVRRVYPKQLKPSPTA